MKKEFKLMNLEQLKEDIFRKQFYDYDETVDAMNVLDKLQNLKNNPELLNYVCRCLESQNLDIGPKKFYSIIIHIEHRLSYDEKFWKGISEYTPFERYLKECIDGNYGLKNENILYPKVFGSISEAEEFALDINKIKEHVPFFTTHMDNENILFEKYSIREYDSDIEFKNEKI